MNKVILTGRIVKDIELRTTQSGKSCMINTIAVRRDFKNANGDYDSDFINFLVFDAQAEYLSKYAAKGLLIELVGRWQHRSYQNREGGTSYADEVIVESVSILEKKKEEKKDEQYESIISEMDLPF